MYPLVIAEPERPFWGFRELFLTAAILFASLIGALTAAARYFHASPDSGLWDVLAQFAAYFVAFLAVKMMFLRHGHGLRDGLGWNKPGPFSATQMAVTGLVLSAIVALLQVALLTPDNETPFEKLVADPAGRIAVAIFGISIGPLAEELLFRGLLQPVLMEATGVLPGILLTSAVFGGLHLAQNGFAWQSGVLIMLVGFVLGTIRHVSGSTRASTIAHIAYNGLPFLALLFANPKR